eukprot:c21797_g1_i1.p1 GENE.c21797_g1_i1~~c21797_g1_i1.p1  ORF type:complete len:624 (-),score=186.95 c21797_g1_i1:35-1906(-)
MFGKLNFQLFLILYIGFELKLVISDELKKNAFGKPAAAECCGSNLQIPICASISNSSIIDEDGHLHSEEVNYPFYNTTGIPRATFTFPQGNNSYFWARFYCPSVYENEWFINGEIWQPEPGAPYRSKTWVKYDVKIGNVVEVAPRENCQIYVVYYGDGNPSKTSFDTCFKTAPSGCDANPLRLGDGHCDNDFNTAVCRYDGGDCCPQTCVEGTRPENSFYACGSGGYNCTDTQYFAFYVDACSKRTELSFDYALVNMYPHRRTSNTQGIIFDHQGNFFESTGNFRDSKLSTILLTTGETISSQPFFDNSYAKGLTISGSYIYILSYQFSSSSLTNEGVLSVYKKDSFQNSTNVILGPVFTGIANNETHLFLSNGSSVISIYHIADHTYSSSFTVYYKNSKLENIDELELIDDYLWAVVRGNGSVYVICPQNGFVIGRVNLEQLESNLFGISVLDLSAIAYNSQNGLFYVTGINWPKVFELNVYLVLSTPTSTQSASPSTSPSPSASDTPSPSALPTPTVSCPCKNGICKGNVCECSYGWTGDYCDESAIKYVFITLITFGAFFVVFLFAWCWRKRSQRFRPSLSVVRSRLASKAPEIFSRNKKNKKFRLDDEYGFDDEEERSL